MIDFNPMDPTRDSSPLPADLVRLDAALRAWGASQRSDPRLAERVIAASRPHLPPRVAMPPVARLRWAGPARFALAASLLGALLLASFWGGTPPAAPAGDHRGLAAIPPLDDAPLSEPLLLAMLDGDAAVSIGGSPLAWKELDREDAGGDLLSVVFTRESGLDDYAAEIESILGGIPAAASRPRGL